MLTGRTGLDRFTKWKLPRRRWPERSLAGLLSCVRGVGVGRVRRPAKIPPPSRLESTHLAWTTCPQGRDLWLPAPNILHILCASEDAPLLGAVGGSPRSSSRAVDAPGMSGRWWAIAGLEAHDAGPFRRPSRARRHAGRRSRAARVSKCVRAGRSSRAGGPESFPPPCH